MRRIVLGWTIVLWLFPGLSWATTLTAGDVLSRARVYLRDQSTSANRQQFPDATLLQFLSDGQREANAQNWLLVNIFKIALSTGVGEYVAPDDFIGTLRVWFTPPGGTAIKIDQTSLEQLDAQSSNWATAQGVPTSYYIDRTGSSASSSSVYIGVFPPVETSTGTLNVFYIQNAKDVASTSAIPFNGQLVLQPYVSALSYYVAYRGFLSVEETDLANAYLQYWITFLAIMRQGTTKTPDFNPGFIGQHGPP